MVYFYENVDGFHCDGYFWDFFHLIKKNEIFYVISYSRHLIF